MARQAREAKAKPAARSSRVAGAAALAALVFVPDPLLAQQDGELKAATQQLQTNRRMLEDHERKALTLQADVAVIDHEQGRLNRDLQDTAKQIQSLEAKLTTIEERQGELEEQRKLLQGSLDQQHDSIAKLLGAMQRMGRNPPPVIITRREDALQMVRSAMLLAKAFPELHSQAMKLAGELMALGQVVDNIKTERERLAAETARHRDARTRLASLMEAKRQTLSERQQELDEVRKTAQEIAKSVTDLSELISRLDKAVGERTLLGSYEKEAAAGPAPQPGPGAPDPTPAAGAQPTIAAPKPAPPAAQPPSQVAVAVPPKPVDRAIELAPSGGVMAANPGRMKPAVAFHLAKGQLPSPAPQGRRVLSFGDRAQSGGTSKGIVLETRHGSRITSPCDGWVVYAGEFRTYGQLLIINAGGGYHVLLAGLSQIDPQLGQFLLAAEPVGTMRQQTKGHANDNLPVLYVEFRKDGRPIDPDPWWVESSQKVQG
jgi:septal ring factor EnvC (AmiA/AmiB activator)